MKPTSVTGSVMVNVAVALFLGLLLGGSVGYLIAANQQEARDQALQAGNQTTTPTGAAAPTETEAERLRVMLVDKENAYAELREAYDQLKNQPGASANPSTNTTTTSRGEGSADRPRRDDPARTQQIDQEREQRRQAIETRFQELYAGLEERRQRAQSAEEIALLEGLTASLVRLQEQGAAWQNIRSESSTNRVEQYRQLAEDSRAAYQTYSDLLTQDRQFRLNQLAAQAGYKDPAQAKQFADAIQKIFRETSPSGLFGFGSGRSRGGRGGGTGTATP